MAPVDAPLPGEVGIRPGSWMISPFLCTMNFIFQNGGTLAIGTAGPLRRQQQAGPPDRSLQAAPTRSWSSSAASS